MSLTGKTRYSRDETVFETTPDSPSKTTNGYEDDRKSHSVEQIESNVRSSFNVFKGKQLGTHQTDFSSKVGRPLQYGFRAEMENLEMAFPSREPETVLQRYHRLKQEVSDLVSEVEGMEGSKELGNVSTGDIISDLQQLHGHLHQLELDRTLSNSVLSGGGMPHHSLLLKDLQSQLAAAKASTSEDNAAPGLVYEVYGNVEAAKFGHLSKLSEVEERLAAVESLVGNTDTKGSVIAAGLAAESKDLFSTVLALQAKVTLLAPDHVLSIASQLQTMLNTLSSLQAKSKETTDNPEHNAKVTEAIETVATVKPLATLVPDLVDRLHALKDLHQHAAQLAGSVATMAEQQERTQQQLSSLTSLLQEVQESVGGNFETLQSNLTDLDSRVKALQK